MSILSGVGSVIGAIGSLWSDRQNRKLQREINAQNQANYDEQFQYQKKIDERDFNYTQELNKQSQYNLEHQYSIAAKDASSAGINPLALNGASAGSASFTGSSGNGAVSTPDLKAPQMADFGNIINTAMQTQLGYKQLAQQKDIADKQLKIEDKKADADIAQKNMQTETATLIGKISKNISQLKDVFPNFVQSGKDLVTEVRNLITALNKKDLSAEEEARVKDLLNDIEDIPEEDRRIIFGDNLTEKIKALYNRFGNSQKDLERGVDVYKRLQALRQQEGRDW